MYSENHKSQILYMIYSLDTVGKQYNNFLHKFPFINKITFSYVITGI